MERLTHYFAYKANQYLIDEWFQQIATQITHEERP